MLDDKVAATTVASPLGQAPPEEWPAYADAFMQALEEDARVQLVTALPESLLSASIGACGRRRRSAT